MGSACFESHDTPESAITCCSKLAKDGPLWHKNFLHEVPHVTKGHEE